MFFDCIRLLPILILALIAAFGRCAPRGARDEDFNFDATITCSVKGSSIVGKDEENPDYCWAFAYYMKNKTEYADWIGRKCCATDNTTDDIPKDSELKKIVNIHF